jgi:hypothetical protein
MFGMVFVVASNGAALSLVHDNLYYVNFFHVKTLIAFIDAPFQLHNPHIHDMLNPCIIPFVVPLKNSIPSILT